MTSTRPKPTTADAGIPEEHDVTSPDKALKEKIMSETTARTPATPGVLEDPIRNRGVAFTAAEREALGLTGRLPSAVLTLEEQARRASAYWSRR